MDKDMIEFYLNEIKKSKTKREARAYGIIVKHILEEYESIYPEEIKKYKKELGSLLLDKVIQ